ELIELKAERRSIGENDQTVFENITIPPGANRSFYLFSDGVKDQFGGPKQKKLSSKRFKQILHQASSLPVDQQHKFIFESITSWKAGMPQTDDMLVIGLQF
ncbi:MAG: tetratricopeptide repeat protein, partial [Bacteroidetes bacterium]|nr:tetratricopeptide repeat protein [Bacteroidota bacterium]